jgi:hypothetical protein
VETQTNFVTQTQAVILSKAKDLRLPFHLAQKSLSQQALLNPLATRAKELKIEGFTGRCSFFILPRKTPHFCPAKTVQNPLKMRGMRDDHPGRSACSGKPRFCRLN